MEGHSQLHTAEMDAAESIIDAFKSSKKKVKLKSLDEKMNRMEHDLEIALSKKLMASWNTRTTDVRPEVEEESKTVTKQPSLLITGATDSKVLELLISMNAKMIDLDRKVDVLQQKLDEKNHTEHRRTLPGSEP
jgi:hypothetical protein